MATFSTADQVLVGAQATDAFAPASGSLALGQLESTAIPVDLPSDTFRSSRSSCATAASRRASLLRAPTFA